MDRLLALVAALATSIAAALPAAETAAGATTAKPFTWRSVARSMTIPVFRPTRTKGLRVAYVNHVEADPGCDHTVRRQMLRSIYYGTRAGRTLEVLEGHPRYCTDEPIDAPLERRLRIHGKRAELYDLCGSGARDCDGLAGAWALEWCEKGTTITLVGSDLTARRLISIGKSMREVGRERARRCA